MEMIEIENINIPGKKSRVDREKYEAMKKALLMIMPKKEPGISQKQMKVKVIPHLPEAIFPNGQNAGWWSKTVQLDLEAKGILRRVETKPLTWVLVNKSGQSNH